MRLLAQRDFRRLFAARAVSSFGDGFLPIALAFAVLDLTGSAADVGFVLAASALPSLGLLLAGGVLGDRVPRARLMLWSDLTRMLVQGTAGTLLVTGTAELWHLLVLQVADGAAEGLHSPAANAVVPQVVDQRDLRPANALLGLAIGLAYTFGPAIGGLLIAATDPGWALLLDSLTFLASALLLAGLRVESPAPKTDASLIRQMAEGWSEFSSRPWLWVMVLQWALLLLIAEAPLDVLGPIVARNDLGGAGSWGLIESGFAAGMLMGRVVALRFPPRYPLRASAVALLFASSGYAALAIPASVVWILAMRFAAGIAFTFYGTLWTTTLQQRVHPARLARVSSFEWFGSMALTPAGYALAGPASDSIGVPNVLWIGASWVFLSALLLLTLPSVRNLASDETDPQDIAGS